MSTENTPSLLSIVKRLTSLYIADLVTMDAYDFGYKYYGDNICPEYYRKVDSRERWLKGRTQARLDNNYKETN